MNEQEKPHKRRKHYTLEEDTAIVARTVINIVDTSTIDPHPLIVALLEGYAGRIRTLYTEPTRPGRGTPHH